MILVCHVIFEDRVTKGSSDMGRSPPKISHHFAKFYGHRHCGSGNILVLVCHVISQDHVIKGSCDFFSLPLDLDSMTSSTPAWLASFELTPLDALLFRFIGHKSYGNGDINSYITYINILEKAELTASIRQTERFSKSGISIFNCEVPGTTGRKNHEKSKGNCKALFVSRKYSKKWVTT